MNRTYSLKYSAVAVFLALVFAFAVPMSISAPFAASVSAKTGAESIEKSETVVLTAGNEMQNLSASAQSEQTTPSPDKGTEDYKDAETMPDSGAVISPDDILPDDGDGATDVGGGYEEKEGVTVIPATVNNIMRDSLPSIISKKVYTFSLDERGAIMYAFNHTEVTENSCLWYVTLYEEYSPDGTGKTTDYRVLNRVSYESVGAGVQSSAIGVLPGNYRVEVECISGYTEQKYNIYIGFASTSFYEAEPNNTETRYNELPLNRTVSGSASVLPDGKADTDTYLFRITDTGYTVLYFEHENDDTNVKDNIAWKITLTDTDGNEYFYTTSPMDFSSVTSGIMGLPEGYYFITVSSHMHTNVSYSLYVSFSEDTAVESELNETPETADPIEINTEKVGSLTARYLASDRDYYTFTMENDGFIVIDFIHEAMTEDKESWNVSLLSENGDVIYSDTSNRTEAVLQTPNIGLTAGRYFIRIDSDNLYHSSTVYRLILLTVQNTNWETEPNNIPAEADILNIGDTVNGTVIVTGVDYDRDWYGISVPESTELTISFGHIKTNEAGKEGWTISVVDAGGNIINNVSSDWDEDELTFTQSLTAGDYYILIESGLYFNSNRYILTVS